MTAFTVLMPLYHGDAAAFLAQGLDSLFEGQELLPSQVVLVQDGPVGSDLAAVVADWANRPEVTVVRLATNQGISAALNAGLAVCRHPIVARADADDLTLPGRFAAQVPMVAGGLDLVGGAMLELAEAAPAAKRQAAGDGIVRQYPLTQGEIERFARLHNPFAHPTVVFRTSLVKQAGGYPPLNGFEDYLLWARLLQAGAKVANTDQVVVAYRVSRAAYARRGGLKTALSEVKLQRTFKAMGFTSRRQAVLGTLLRVGFELAPVGWRQRPLRRALRAGNFGTTKSAL